MHWDGPIIMITVTKLDLTLDEISSRTADSVEIPPIKNGNSIANIAESSCDTWLRYETLMDKNYKLPIRTEGTS